jgi:protein gp37
MTTIEWTKRPGTRGETWNPVAGCTILSPGCTHCYAMRMAARIEAINAAAGTATHYAGTTKPSKAGPVWTGKLAVAPDAIFLKPLRWRAPRTVFVNSMSDLFHEDVPDAVIDRAFAVMALTPNHTYQILTKRSARMRAYISGFECDGARRFNVADAAGRMMEDGDNACDEVSNCRWPLPNVWLGVSAERQQEADERVPDLLATPAAIRFVSAEPLLGEIDFSRVGTLESIRAALPEVARRCERETRPNVVSGMQIDALGGPHQATIFHQTPNHMGGFAITFPRPFPRLDQIIVGGESGPVARPMHPAWARHIRDDCQASGAAFFFKQWGAHRPLTLAEHGQACGATLIGDDPHDRDAYVLRVGKANAGRLLDGAEHNEWPKVRVS